MSASFFQTLGTPAQRVAGEETRLLRLAGRDVPLVVRAHPRARRLTLRIEPGGHGLHLTVPPRTRRRDVDGFLERHEEWATERLSRLPNVPVVEVGALVPIGGVPHQISHGDKLRGLTRVEAGDPPRLVVFGPTERAGARVSAFLKARAKADMEPLVERYAGEIGRPARLVRFKDTRSRWGSCTADGALSFSWRLAMAPPFVMDALAAHEVAHLKHMNHGEAFWALARDLCPDTDQARQWLREHGSGLHAYRFEG